MYDMYSHLTNINVYDILRIFREEETRLHDAKSYTYIIMGKPGATGKTRLCQLLKERGLNAIEISENIVNLVEYNDNKNHVIVDTLNMQVVIILNKPLVEETTDE